VRLQVASLAVVCRPRSQYATRNVGLSSALASRARRWRGNGPRSQPPAGKNRTPPPDVLIAPCRRLATRKAGRIVLSCSLKLHSGPLTWRTWEHSSSADCQSKSRVQCRLADRRRLCDIHVIAATSRRLPSVELATRVQGHDRRLTINSIRYDDTIPDTHSIGFGTGPGFGPLAVDVQAQAVRTATATATVADGYVIGVTLVDGGGGYGVSPTVTFAGGNGSGAAALAQVANGMVYRLALIDAVRV